MAKQNTTTRFLKKGKIKGKQKKSKNKHESNKKYNRQG